RRGRGGTGQSRRGPVRARRAAHHRGLRPHRRAPATALRHARARNPETRSVALGSGSVSGANRRADGLEWRRAMGGITVRVPAKVNLQLAVGPLRDDGYHDLVNVFHAVSLFDEVTAAEPGTLIPPAGESTVAEAPLRVVVQGESAAEVPVDDNNLAVRAAQALAKRAGRSYRAD